MLPLRSTRGPRAPLEGGLICRGHYLDPSGSSLALSFFGDGGGALSCRLDGISLAWLVSGLVVVVLLLVLSILQAARQTPLPWGLSVKPTPTAAVSAAFLTPSLVTQNVSCVGSLWCQARMGTEAARVPGQHHS